MPQYGDTAGHADHARAIRRIEHCLPLQRGNVGMTNLQVINVGFVLVVDGLRGLC